MINYEISEKQYQELLSEMTPEQKRKHENGNRSLEMEYDTVPLELKIDRAMATLGKVTAAELLKSYDTKFKVNGDNV